MKVWVSGTRAEYLSSTQHKYMYSFLGLNGGTYFRLNLGGEIIENLVKIFSPFGYYLLPSDLVVEGGRWGGGGINDVEGIDGGGGLSVAYYKGFVNVAKAWVSYKLKRYWEEN